MALHNDDCLVQVHPFEEEQLKELPRNMILSQEWRIGARPVPLTAQSHKPVPYQSNVSAIKATSSPSDATAQQQQRDVEKRQSLISETNGHYLTPTTSNHSTGVASLVQPVHQVTETGASPVVSNLIKIYSEATGTKSQTQNHRATSTTVNHFDELTRIVREAAQKIEQAGPPSPPKRSEERDQISWENLVHG